MRCPRCDYELDPTTGLQCPRCGEQVDCTAVSCGDCNACSGLLGGLGIGADGGDEED